MTLNFLPQNGSSVDVNSGLTICAPRMLPATPPEDPKKTEYQYNFRRNGEWFYGLGIHGTYEVLNSNKKIERLYTLDLGGGRILDSLFQLKEELGNNDDNFVFLQDLARGLINVFKLGVNEDNRRYRVIADPAILSAYGVSLAENNLLSSGELVLAEELVSANKVGSDAP